MPKVNFFYANGTAYLLNLMEVGFSVDIGGIIRFGNRMLNPNTSKTSSTVPGLNGKTAVWNGGPENDPFPFLLNPDVWNITRISYPAATIGIGPSVDYGVGQTIKLIKATPPGQPFALGGYSQGAAVMSGVYNEIKNPAGQLYSRRGDFIGAVCFGNPRRQLNFRGPIGGTWSGSWDVPGSNTGGHGSFPATGPYARLSGCDATKWVEFAAPLDIFSSTGDSTNGTNWTAGNDLLLNLLTSQYVGSFLTQAAASLIGISSPLLTAIQAAFAISGGSNYYIDYVGKPGQIGGMGHTTYPFLGPPNTDGTYSVTSQVINGQTYLKPTGDTCYQLALAWLEAQALAWATAPVVLSGNFTGWSTTLVPPAS